MAEGRLVIGTQRYSSWSLRGWLCVRLAGLDVAVQVVPLAGGGQTTALKTLSPNGCVPYLEHKDAVVWDSLSIAEYCAEHHGFLWPTDRAARAWARSAAAEMHSGFRAVRSAFPMNLGRNRPLPTPLGEDVLKDIARINAIWTEGAGRGGPFLCGPGMGNVDAMFAPVVCRFLSYDVPGLSPTAHAYMQALRHHPLMEEWYAAAAREPVAWQLDMYESLA
ncbi:glutathione S-transferase family protein [Acetobacter okinawensis]|uniref:glutathione S-transferase family protein n=1 Tax=Acetobacter okinawensis TaxID=1076594 RepID=UPI001BA7E2A0|nr:glutathione S-transferase family protein [Acetobacter okinawensis]MBS0990097.1 glutathione S-transferase family protein [Acetobacter okinawensis]